MAETGQKTRKFINYIKNDSVARTVMEQIKNALISKTLSPGDRLPTETEMCATMGVGKSSIREAIKMLGILGVVETRQGDGTYISSSITEHSVNPLVYQLLIDYGSNSDVFELRSMFEPAYTLLALKKATPEDIEHIIGVSEEFNKKVHNHVQTADDDLNFHRTILEATHNPLIIRIGLTVMQLFYASIANSMLWIPEQAVKDHKSILNAFLKKDEEALLRAVYNSFKGWKSMMNREDR
ncbi:GntR family transcriptional regulator [Spirochaetia bacterium]|nr:GntR family transcriptional regulator [Spirochaetia bacterium]